MTMTNSNGGVSCRFTTAKGYTDRGEATLLPSGIRSGAIKWEGFEYDDVFALPPKHKTFREYKPEGMITQLPALRLDYKGKNSAGGRKALPGYIGAATREIRKAPWEKGLDWGDTCKVLFVTDHHSRVILRNMT